MSKKVDYKAQIQRLQQISVLAYLGLAALAGWLMSAASYQLSVSYLAKDDLASKTNTVFAPASHGVFDVELKWLIVVIMVLAAVMPYMGLMRYRGAYQRGLKNRIAPIRWLDMGITAALMVEVVALLSGIQDIIVLKLVAGLMVTTCVLGWLSEKQNVESRKPAWSAYVISLFTGCLPWLLIGVAALATPFYSAVRAPWYVYGLYVSSLFCFVLFAKNQKRAIKKIGPWKDYLFVERNYVFISLVSKVTFAAILIIGLKK